MPAKQKIFIPVPVSERTPTERGYYHVYHEDPYDTRDFPMTGEFNPNTGKFYNTYDDGIEYPTHWLEEKEGYFLSQEELRGMLLKAYYLAAEGEFEEESEKLIAINKIMNHG